MLNLLKEIIIIKVIMTNIVIKIHKCNHLVMLSFMELIAVNHLMDINLFNYKDNNKIIHKINLRNRKLR